MKRCSQDDPGCVGLSRIGSYPNTVRTVWSDMISKKVPWYLRLVPMQWIGWNRNGAYFKIKK
jgi:hypothetical protein